MIWDSEVKEMIFSTNSGQIGVLPNHAPIATALGVSAFIFAFIFVLIPIVGSVYAWRKGALEWS
ncbi:hypothetical protein KSP39_PZI007340 [Platanthera zijinensis]|uniref:ATP synthase F1 complex delta/epsilon subunit N-terminal domain-containing protein n=1 Tax=Platanthera zijinensis TaxID=2320716 RepID=A0AAP0BR46_9ASPA